MNKADLKEHFKALKVETALKLVITGIICILINNFFHLELGYFSALFSFLLIVLFHGEIIKVGLQALAGAVISGLVSILLAYLFIESSLVYVLVMSVWILIVVALLVKYFLAMLISGVAATMIMYNSIFNSVGEVSTLFENYVLQLLIAIVAASLIDGVFWPHRSRGSFQITIKTVYEEFSALFDGYVNESAEDRTAHQSMSTKLTTFSDLAAYVNRMQKEESRGDFPIDQYLKIITFSRGIFIKIEVLEEYVLKEHSFMKYEGAAKNLNRIFGLISESFSELARSIGTKNVLKTENKELQESITSLHKLYREMHEIEGRDTEYYEDLLALGAMLPVIEDIADKIRRIAEAVNVFHTDNYQKMLQGRVTHADNIEKIRKRAFFSPDKESLIVGFKTVVIFLLLMLGEAALGLPGGNQVVFFAILFGVIPNLGQAYMKSKYGVIGVSWGLAMSFIGLMVLLIVPNFLIVICLYSLGTFIAAYVASSSKDISAAALQAGLLFPFGILITTGPNLEINEALTRFLALLSAVFIGLIVQHTLWPVNPFQLLKRKISKSISYCGQILSKLVALDIKDRDKVDALVLPIAASLPSSTSLLHDAEYIIRQDELHAEEFIHIIESIELIYADLETIKRTIYGHSDSEIFHLYLNHMSDDYGKLASYFEKVSTRFGSDVGELTTRISDLKAKIEKDRSAFRDSEVWRKFSPEDIEMSVLVATNVDSLLNSLYKIAVCIDTINGAEPLEDAGPTIKEPAS